MYTKNLLFLTFFITTVFIFVFNHPTSQAETENPENIQITEETKETSTETETKNQNQTTTNQEGEGNNEEIIENPDKNSDDSDNNEKDEFKTTEPETNDNEITTNSSTKNSLLSKEKQLRIINLSANISNRLDAALNRHTQIADRLKSRIEKLNQQGFNTTKTKTILIEIKKNLEETKNSLKDIDSLVYEMATAPNPSQNWPKIKTLYQDSVSKITKNQTDLKHLLSLLKNPINQPETNHDLENITSNTGETKKDTEQ